MDAMYWESKQFGKPGDGIAIIIVNMTLLTLISSSNYMEKHLWNMVTIAMIDRTKQDIEHIIPRLFNKLQNLTKYKNVHTKIIHLIVNIDGQINQLMFLHAKLYMQNSFFTLSQKSTNLFLFLFFLWQTKTSLNYHQFNHFLL